MSKSRGYVYTLNMRNTKGNTWTKKQIRKACTLCEEIDCVFHVAQLEKAPTTGTVHIQGALWFATPRSLASVLKRFSPYHPHLEVARGEAKESLVYCRKSETRITGGLA